MQLLSSHTFLQYYCQAKIKPANTRDECLSIITQVWSVFNYRTNMQIYHFWNNLCLISIFIFSSTKEHGLKYPLSPSVKSSDLWIQKYVSFQTFKHRLSATVMNIPSSVYDAWHYTCAKIAYWNMQSSCHITNLSRKLNSFMYITFMVSTEKLHLGQMNVKTSF